jgi:prefoldin subunit 5
MSIQLTMRVKELGGLIRELEAKVAALSARISELESTDETSAGLTAQYEKKFGSPPHHRMKRETIERALRE